VRLDIDYPFHSSLLDDEHAALLYALSFLKPNAPEIPYSSATDDNMLDGPRMDAEYWWRNIRNPVHFRAAVERAVELGANTFVEISPRPILLNAVGDTARDRGINPLLLPTLEDGEQQPATDPIETLRARMIVNGAMKRPCDGLDADPAGFRELPLYPWQHQNYAIEQTAEAILQMGSLRGQKRHPLLGTRMADGSPEWRMVLDDSVVPYLADHKVGNEIVVPGAALIEIALSAAAEIYGNVPIEVNDLDVFRALVISGDEMREISVRFEGSRSRIEIWSRRRFADDWTLHAAARVGPIERPAPPSPTSAVGQDCGAEERVCAPIEVYSATESAGLNYGPSFRRVSKLVIHKSGMIAEFAPSTLDAGAFDPSSHFLDPSSLDAAFHGLFIDTADGRTDNAQNAFLPVRVGRLSVWRPYEPVSGAEITLTRKTKTARIADAVLLGQSGEVIAELSDVYLRRVTLTRKDTHNRIVRTELPVVQSYSNGDVAATQAVAKTAAANTDMCVAPWQLNRALCLSAAQELLIHHAPSGRLSVADFEQSEALPARDIRAALQVSQQAGLAVEDESGWSIDFDEELPGSSVLLATLAERFPEAQADLQLGARTVARVNALRDSTHMISDVPMPDRTLRALFCDESTLFVQARQQAVEAIADLQTQVKGRRPRILVVDGWTNGLRACLADVLQAQTVELVFAASGTTDADGLPDIARLSSNHSFVDLDGLDEDDWAPANEAADAVLLGPVWSNTSQALDSLSRALLLCGDRCRALLWDVPADSALILMLGSEDDGTEDSDNPPSSAAIQAKGLLQGEGFRFAAAPSDNPLAAVAFGQRVGEPRTAPSAKVQILPGSPHCPIDERLAGTLAALSGEGDPVFIDLPDAPESEVAAAARVERRVMRLAGHLKLQARREESVPLWIVTRGALQNGPSGGPDADAIWRFARVAMNEYPEIDIRLVDLTLDLSNKRSARRLTDLLANPGREKELLVGRNQMRVPRMISGAASALAPLEADDRARLMAMPGQSFDQITWQSEKRRAPAGSEIEIQNQAIGLNFRDVMLGLGILDEDLLGHGLTSSALGFECVGEVVRLGEDVDDLAVGELVMGFADDAFASHVTAPRAQFFRVPAGVTATAASTIPVAFCTAWYALNTVARLQEGETLLLHGAAGGVGMAAMQIARMNGARVIATAGTEAKRTLVRALGAEAVYDSRSVQFADDINAEHGGVDVVLNSLAGEQMWASLRTLKPFGRFVELGKRDFLENTPVDLRPFVRNRSYFGVDLDELLAHDKPLVDSIVQDIRSAFEAGDLLPLPHRIFDGADVSEAFRLMQRSGHVGKIIVRPAKATRPIAQCTAFTPASGVHLVVGGTSGFGFETAVRLAERGAEKVVIASRNGVQDVHIQRRIATYGDQIVVERVDATNASQVDALCQRVRADHGPIVGVTHTAMILEDGFIDGLTAESLHRVAAPKTLAAEALHKATANDKLQYFVVYSSATTVIGSPGQAAYVLANGYLEGLILQRRRQGLPGLAVAWGAISDAGAISRDAGLGERLERTTGVTGISSKEALDHLELLLGSGDQAAPIETYTAMGESAVAGKLAILSTPAFTHLKLGQVHNAQGEVIDLAALLREKPEVEVLETLVELTIEEIAKILRMPADSIDPDEPLAVIGMDSLMGLELRLGFEARFGVELPLLSIGDLSVDSLSRKLLEDLRTEEGAGDSDHQFAEALLSVHSAESEPSTSGRSSMSDDN
jgi:phthiocerol/phenolphthiocerol synthesis type-I polyketide synthase C